MNKHKPPVFLIGFMGSGKTTWGQKLAKRTGRTFIDLDAALVKDSGMAIADYFSRHGEAAFRALESRLLKKLPITDPAIISTGGGTPCYFDNMAWMNEVGITIYLRLPPKALCDRLMQTDIASRPALLGLSGEALLNHVATKLAEREPYYNQATYIVDQLSVQTDELVRLVE